MTNEPVASEPRLVALCDACVLYSITMADLLTSLGEAGLYNPRWTHEIHNEWIRNLIEDRGASGTITREKLEARRDAMIEAIDSSLVEEYEDLIPTVIRQNSILVQVKLSRFQVTGITLLHRSLYVVKNKDDHFLAKDRRKSLPAEPEPRRTSQSIIPLPMPESDRFRSQVRARSKTSNQRQRCANTPRTVTLSEQRLLSANRQQLTTRQPASILIWPLAELRVPTESQYRLNLPGDRLEIKIFNSHFLNFPALCEIGRIEPAFRSPSSSQSQSIFSGRILLIKKFRP